MDDFVLLTPDVRKTVVSSINEQLKELEKCKNTAYVKMLRQAYIYERNLINALPDGYPLPVKR